MTSEADKRAYAKWISNPENKKKHSEWCRQRYLAKKRAMYEPHIDALMALGGDRKALAEYIYDNFNLKKRD